MTIIIYNSKTGSCKRYAEILSERTGLKCYSVNDDYPKDDDIVFFGWLRKFTVVGLSKVDKSKVKRLCVVGFDNPRYFPLENIVKTNGCDVETYYLRGWLKREKLGFMEKLIMKIVSKKLKKRPGGAENDEVIDAMLHGGDFFDESYLTPVEESLKG